MIQIVVDSRRIKVYFCDFLAVSRALEIMVNSAVQKCHGCKMTEKGPKIKSQRIQINEENAFVHCRELSTAHLLPWY